VTFIISGYYIIYFGAALITWIAVLENGIKASVKYPEELRQLLE